jgi:hypothetical protein
MLMLPAPASKLRVIEGDVLDVLKHQPPDETRRYHAVLSDPPYGTAFMNKRWDAFQLRSGAGSGRTAAAA